MREGDSLDAAMGRHLATSGAVPWGLVAVALVGVAAILGLARSSGSDEPPVQPASETADESVAPANLPPTITAGPLIVHDVGEVETSGRFLIVSDDGAVEVDLDASSIRPVDLADTALVDLAGGQIEQFNDKMILARPRPGTDDRLQVVTFDGDGRLLIAQDAEVDVVIDPDQAAWYVRTRDRSGWSSQLYRLSSAGFNDPIRSVPSGARVMAATSELVAVAVPGRVAVFDHLGKFQHDLTGVQPLFSGRDWFLGFSCDEVMACDSTVVDLASGSHTDLRWRTRLDGAGILSPSGTRLAVADKTGSGNIVVVDAANGTIVDTGLPAVPAGSFVFSPMGEDWLVVDTGNHIVIGHVGGDRKAMVIAAPDLGQPRTLMTLGQLWGPYRDTEP